MIRLEVRSSRPTGVLSYLRRTFESFVRALDICVTPTIAFHAIK